MLPNQFKVWIEISRSAILHNFEILRNVVSSGAEIWSVVKSNAYGHGIFAFAKLANEIGVHGFCVDSVIEGVKLREQRINKPILVLGPTLPALFGKASQHKLTLSVSNWQMLESLVREIESPADQPELHLKVDTGMHRQGFSSLEMRKVLKYVGANSLKLRGLFSHFAAAKDLAYPGYSEEQFKDFENAIALCEAAGFTGLKKHIAATGGALLNQKYHLDLVRTGIGLYGIFPSKELEIQLTGLDFQPVLSWHALISEVKRIPKGSYIGYDMTERVNQTTDLAIVPIGYWHGFPWALSGRGSVLVNGKRAKVLGRVSMDMIAVDVTGLKAKVGTQATILGAQGKSELSAREIALAIHTTPYEIITRINPLIERVIVP